MTSKNTEVRLTVDTLSVTDNDSDRVSVTYDGTLYDKNGSVYVLYEDGETCSVKQSGSTVRVCRHKSGGRMTFEAGQKHPAVMNTPVGPMQMTVDTLSLSGTLETGLEIIYHLIYADVIMAKNTVNIKIEEK